MTPPLSFTVFGVAAPAGSKRALPYRGRPGGRPIIVDDSKRSRPWKQQVAQVAGAAMAGRTLLEGPLELHLVFYMPRPKGHFGTRGLRPAAPAYPTVKPDTTKLIRAVEDALTGLVWRDDAQVVKQIASKEYTTDQARVVVVVAPVTAAPPAQPQLAVAAA